MKKKTKSDQLRESLINDVEQLRLIAERFHRTLQEFNEEDLINSSGFALVLAARTPTFSLQLFSGDYILTSGLLQKAIVDTNFQTVTRLQNDAKIQDMMKAYQGKQN